MLMASEDPYLLPNYLCTHDAIVLPKIKFGGASWTFFNRPPSNNSARPTVPSIQDTVAGSLCAEVQQDISSRATVDTHQNYFEQSSSIEDFDDVLKYYGIVCSDEDEPPLDVREQETFNANLSTLKKYNDDDYSLEFPDDDYSLEFPDYSKSSGVP